MALQEEGIVQLTRRDIAASGIGSDPKAVAAYESLQRMAFEANPAAAQAAQETAETAVTAAEEADTKAVAAQTAAVDASTAAGVAQARADDAYSLAEGKADKSTRPAWGEPTGALSRAAFASYTAPVISNPPTQAEVQALADAVQTLSRALVAAVSDLRSTEALKA